MIDKNSIFGIIALSFAMGIFVGSIPSAIYSTERPK